MEVFDLIFLTSTLLVGALLLLQLNCKSFTSGWFALCMAAFVPGPSNMRAQPDALGRLNRHSIANNS